MNNEAESGNFQILYVDESNMLQLSFGIFLRSKGITVYTANNGLEAIK